MGRTNSRQRSSDPGRDGLGLLEVLPSRSDEEEADATLPPGQRDGGGFWFPMGYSLPGDIFTPAQRRLQARQRQVQRNRLERQPAVPSGETDSTTSLLASELAERTMPLPAPSPEAPVVVPSSSRAVPGAAPQPSARPGHPVFSGGELVRAAAARGVVDSGKGSD